MKLTLKDIAQALGISVATVSKALKNYSDVSPATKKIVLDYVEKVKFKPNAQASFLRTQKTKLVGVILPKLNHDFFNEVLEGIVSEAEKNTYQVLVLCSQESYEKEVLQVNELLQRNVDGIFLSISMKTYKYDHLKQVQKQGIPIILFDRIAKSVPSFRVIIDDQKAAFLATEHLIKQGCKNIAHFRGNLIPQMSIDRFIGFKKALEHYKIPFHKEWCLVCEEDRFEKGFENAKKLLKIAPEVDGLFSMTDSTAIGAIHYFKKYGLKVPKDIAVIGFSNWKISALTEPSLSSVEQNGLLMGKKVIEVFTKTQEPRNEEKEEFTTTTIPVQLCIRESSFKIKT
jgi:LacI family transcriptional regulator